MCIIMIMNTTVQIRYNNIAVCQKTYISRDIALAIYLRSCCIYKPYRAIVWN
jgi:hypothetical protein